MSHDSHSGWALLPSVVLITAWLIARMRFTVGLGNSLAGESMVDPPWLMSLQTIMLFSVFLPRGLVIIADRLTSTQPGFFPLVYLVITLVCFGVLWFWRPQKGEPLSWRGIITLILLVIPLTFMAALSMQKNDPLLLYHLWSIPFILIGIFLLGMAIAKRTYRRQAAIAGLWIAGLYIWGMVAFWIATWIS